ncbi:hypothetical protein JWS13_17595 [Rhodococcus pseudokoreensis]|uniref:Uncharacterized protein n=1 Tax=Rhodococcus pseudokoreensis TaxID=2811421 RepID=A0A974W3H9_9NOCA|nr:hypothetical protein [Rhodococcus pseudokoreensis]QSE90304.1 hypothetical protein JWS13_17595 [Rhodococcus pseudokoreensis]
MAYLITDLVIDDLPSVKYNAETKTVRVTFGLQGHLSLSIAEAVHVVTELAAALGEAESAEEVVRDE